MNAKKARAKAPKEQSLRSSLHVSEARMQLNQRFKDEGYTPNSGHDDEFIEDMVHIFSPFLAKEFR